ncbi:hypothetical protein CDV36_016458 [Fusarium kuroshium]|uniref:Uncharacterized protein n=2 Tax=Fusarium solani species complex TaxID=232080 RepID=A0A3M2QND1_9HYPO|nr:hypothetical protein CDV36_016458 [Fusarium kuroshium]RSL45243.1 hypothetical protein CEP51_016113 [Fusarium floridanum]
MWCQEETLLPSLDSFAERERKATAETIERHHHRFKAVKPTPTVMGRLDSKEPPVAEDVASVRWRCGGWDPSFCKGRAHGLAVGREDGGYLAGSCDVICTLPRKVWTGRATEADSLWTERT